MHGNEVRGRGLLLKLAYFLTHRYDTDPDVKAIVDSTIFHLLPTINPDGFERAAKGCTGVIGRCVLQSSENITLGMPYLLILLKNKTTFEFNLN